MGPRLVDSLACKQWLALFLTIETTRLEQASSNPTSRN